jgi:hypothetical protein
LLPICKWYQEFGENEDATCVPSDPCPEGYHKEDEDETGQCYPDVNCNDWMMVEPFSNLSNLIYEFNSINKTRKLK